MPRGGIRAAMAQWVAEKKRSTRVPADMVQSSIIIPWPPRRSVKTQEPSESKQRPLWSIRGLDEIWIDVNEGPVPAKGPRPNQTPYWLTVFFEQEDEKYSDRKLMELFVEKIESGKFTLSWDHLHTTQRLCISVGAGWSHDCKKPGECEKIASFGSIELCQEAILNRLYNHALALQRKVIRGDYSINRDVVFRKHPAHMNTFHFDQLLGEQAPNSS